MIELTQEMIEQAAKKGVYFNKKHRVKNFIRRCLYDIEWFWKIYVTHEWEQATLANGGLKIKHVYKIN